MKSFNRGRHFEHQFSAMAHCSRFYFGHRQIRVDWRGPEEDGIVLGVPCDPEEGEAAAFLDEPLDTQGVEVERDSVQYLDPQKSEEFNPTLVGLCPTVLFGHVAVRDG